MINHKQFMSKDFYENDGIRSNIWEENKNSGTFIREYIRYSIIKDLIWKKQSFDILDFGCGDGYLSVMLAEAGHRVDSMDLSTERLKKFSDKANRLKIIQINSSISDYKFIKQYDAVILSEVIEHLENYDSVLQVLKTTLKENGAIIITVPYKEKLVNFKCPYCQEEFNLVGHLHSFNETTFHRIADELNLKISHIRTFNNKYTKFLYEALPYKRMFVYRFFENIFTKLYKNGNKHVLVRLSKE